MAVPLAGQQDPMSLLRALTETMLQPEPSVDFSGAQSYVDKLREMAQGRLGQFNDALTAPEPDTTQSNFIQRIAAGSGDMLTGGNQLGATNQRLEQTEVERKTARIQNLKLLADSYEQAAKRAGEAGDMLEEQKLRAKIESTNNNIDRLKMAQQGAEAMMRKQTADADRTAENERSLRSAQTQRDVANIYAAGRGSAGKLSPPKQARYDFYMRRALEAENDRNALRNKTDSEGRLIIERSKAARAQVQQYDAEIDSWTSKAEALLEDGVAAKPEAPASLTAAQIADAALQGGYDEARIREEFAQDAEQFKELGITLPQIMLEFRKRGGGVRREGTFGPPNNPAYNDPIHEFFAGPQDTLDTGALRLAYPNFSRMLSP